MPGFIQSLKSRMPHSPFSPPKQSPAVLPPVESAEPEPEAPVPQTEEQPSAEVLPAEALLAPNASTVALTLTPANGQSSQQLTTPDEEIDEPVPQPAQDAAPDVAASAQPELASSDLPEVSELPEAQPSAAVPSGAEAEVSTPAPVTGVSAEESSVETAQEAGLTEPLPESTPTELPTITETLQDPQEEVLTENTSPKPASILSKRSISRKEPPAITPAEIAAAEATPIDEPTAPILQVEGVTTSDVPPVVAQLSSPEVKQKKKRFALNKRFSSSNTSQDGNSTDDSNPAAKPKKNSALAGRFKNVIGQVRSKVKKDKDAEKSPKEPLSDIPTASDHSVSNGKLAPSEESAARDIAVADDAAVVPAETALSA